MKAETLADLPEAIVSACLRAYRGNGPATREMMRQILIQLEAPKSEHSARLLAKMHQALEASLDG